MSAPRAYSLGLDVGSTSVKAVLVNGSGGLEKTTYVRHLGDPQRVIGRALADLAPAGTLVHPAITGSGSRLLARAWQLDPVHEVSAVAAAAARRVPSARSILEFGGQDAKLIIIEDGRVHMTMNDRCAAGTGVTIDRCLFRLGLDSGAAASVVYDPALSRRVSSKCGVFAETDLCNLARAGVPAGDLVISLADAIVAQCLAVLTRGLTPSPDVVLLGGPPSFLPVLVGAWRHRLSELWHERQVPPGPVQVPEHALLYAALGAAELGPQRAPARGPVPLGVLIERLQASAPEPVTPQDRPLIHEPSEGKARPVQTRWRDPTEVVIGVDIGSTTCKVVALNRQGVPVATASRTSTAPIQDAQSLVADVERQVHPRRVRSLGVTGYGASLLAPILGADVQVLETVAHARSARAFAPEAEVICDVGGQDIKIIALDQAGSIRDFRISSQCSAGIGMLLEATARELGVPLEEYAGQAFAARRAPWFGDTCSVFLESNRITFQRQGFTAGEILAGLARALPRVVWAQVMNGTHPSSLGKTFVLQGGVQRNRAAVQAQVDYLQSEVPGARVTVHPYPAEAGAIGAALCAAVPGVGRLMQRRETIPQVVTVRNDDDTRCRLCQSHCARSFVECQQPDGPPLVHVVGNGCAEGSTPEGGDRRAVRLRKRASALNLLDEEARLFFHPRHAGQPLRPATSPLRIGIPRVLSLYRAAPLFRAYLGALGVRDVVFSPATSEKLWREGASHGANDPCFPVKVVHAHMHYLLKRVHDAGRRLDAIFLPHFTHAVTPVRHCIDTASCPVIAAVPGLVRAAFGEELDRRGITLLDPMVTVSEPQLLRQQMYDAFGPLLGPTERESRHAVKAGVAACQWVDDRLADGAREIFDRLEREPGHGAVLVIGRPYHSDPGLNHRVGEELQAIGYPILTVRSIPRDDDWLRRLLAPDLNSGAIADPYDVRDLLPEVANSGVAERLFAARVAARHGRIGIVDLSNFKCGQDSPAYGPLRELLHRAGTPVCTLHDLDESRPATSIRLRLQTFAHAMEQRGLHPWVS